MSIEQYTPGYAPEEALRRVREMWDLSKMYPIPRWDVTCLCSARSSEGDIQIRSWQFMTQANRPHPWRCNVSTKCTRCSLVLMYGLIVPEDYWQQGALRHGKILILWRDAVKALRT